MKIHCQVKRDEKKERIYDIEVSIPKTNQPIVPGEEANKDVADVLKYLEHVIMNHEWIEEMGYEEKIEVLRQYALYWFLRNIVQIDLFPLPEDAPESSSSE